MLKLIIADDERIIRETISKTIPWEDYGIALVGLCKDGIEAYDMILDESPDIVLTDIRMPGLSGLEVIHRISQTDLDTQFILLSGYGDFSYAKEAMKYGVRHYLLKPCNETQIISSIQDVVEECYHQRASKQIQEQQKQLVDNFHNNIISSILNECVSTGSETNFDSLIQSYNKFMDFYGTGYELYYLYFLEEGYTDACLSSINQYGKSNFPGIPIHGIYVNNTLLIYFQSFNKNYDAFNSFVDKLHFPNQSINLEYKHSSFPNLYDLLRVVLEKVKRYATIYYINDNRMIPICNYQNLIQEVNQLSQQIQGPDCKEYSELLSIFEHINNINFLKQLATTIFMKNFTKNANCSPINTTEFLFTLSLENNIDTVREMIMDKIREVFSVNEKPESSYSGLIEKVMHYVDNNLSDSNLTLKWIADKYLYMNVDYVSKKFIKETGSKFSNYLTDLRIQKAKGLLIDCDTKKIQSVAEQIGCGNNPHYFSQIFKKKVGITPSEYIKKMNG